MKKTHLTIALILLMSALLGPSLFAADLSSAHFIVRDPVIGTGGGYQSSGSFQLNSESDKSLTGTGSSASYAGRYGFLYYPSAGTIAGETLSALVNSSDVSLSWTAVAQAGGFPVSGYKVGKSGTPGGPYTFTSVGNVTSTVYAGLPAGNYYFVVQTLDGSSNVAATSNEVGVTVSSTTIPPTQTQPGGDGSVNYISTGVDFSGIAYPGSKVFLLKDGQIAASTVAGGDAKFTINLNGLSEGSFIFVMYAEDQAGRRSTLFTFPVTVTSGSTPAIGGVYIAPTIAIDKQIVKKGDNLTILGQGAPNGSISISVHSSPEIFVQTTSDKYGGYVYNLDTSILDMGDHITKSKSVLSDSVVTAYGRNVAFKVGTQNVYTDDSSPDESDVTSTCAATTPVDLNNDCHVNLFDYSILAFWYKKPSVPDRVDFNHDGKVNIIDFSIMAHYWTI